MTTEATKQQIGSITWVEDQIRNALKDTDPDDEWGPWVREMFTDKAIVEYSDGTMYEIPWTFDAGTELVTLGARSEVTLEYVAKLEAGRLTAPIVRKNAARQIIYGAVLVPGEPDTDDDVVTRAKVEEVAHAWMESYENLDLDHTLNNVDAVPVESYLTPAEQTVTFGGKQHTLPEGTWILAAKIRDDDVWGKIESGELGGYSIMGVPKAAFKDATSNIAAAGSLKGAALKRTTLADLGPDWECPFVSLVGEPAVPKAKFFAMKSRPAPAEPTVSTTAPTLKDRVRSIFHKEDDMNEEQVTKAIADASEATKTEIAEAVKVGVEEGTKPLTERLDALEAGKSGEPDPAKKNDPDPAAAKGKDDEPDAAAKGEEKPDTVESLKAKLDEQAEEFETFKTKVSDQLDPAKSRAIKGQDADPQPEADPWADPKRDALGRQKHRTEPVKADA